MRLNCAADIHAMSFIALKYKLLHNRSTSCKKKSVFEPMILEKFVLLQSKKFGIGEIV